MAYSQQGGAAGRWFGPGFVYVMTYHRFHGPNNRIDYYKIGCTGDATVRLAEIRRGEKNNFITLLSSFVANEMNGAETAAQQAVIAIGLGKDPARGRATDWFIGSLTSAQVLDAVRNAVYKHNAKNKNK